MRKRVRYILTVCIILGAAIFGMIKRQSYTDITAEENYLESINVAVLQEELALSSCEEMENVLPGVPMILRVEVTGDIEHLFKVSRQKVRIEQVYKGEGLQGGKEIYVHSDHWQMSLTNEPKSIERGFVNILKPGKEYLLFLSNQSEDLYNELPVYKLYDETLIAPVFCYEEVENVPIEASGEHTYIPYAEVKENEFFGETETAIKAWERLKESMFAMYH